MPSVTQFAKTLSPGRYEARTFSPDFTFTVGEGWSAKTEEPTFLDLIPPGAGPVEGTSYHSTLAFNNIETVIKPEKQDELKDPATGELVSNSDVNKGLEVPAPDDIITWLQEHPYLETSEAQPVTIGDKPGIQIDAEVKPVPNKYSEICKGAPCVVLFNARGSYVTLPAGGKSRLTILKDVQGRTVIIGSNAYPGSDFDNIVAQTKKVLETVKF